MSERLTELRTQERLLREKTDRYQRRAQIALGIAIIAQLVALAAWIVSMILR